MVRDIPATGKIAIVVDDGIATGLTMRAAIRSLQKELPSEIIVAAPIAPHEVVEFLKGEADDVVVLDDPNRSLARSARITIPLNRFPMMKWSA